MKNKNIKKLTMLLILTGFTSSYINIKAMFPDPTEETLEIRIPSEQMENPKQTLRERARGAWKALASKYSRKKTEPSPQTVPVMPRQRPTPLTRPVSPNRPTEITNFFNNDIQPLVNEATNTVHAELIAALDKFYKQLGRFDSAPDFMKLDHAIIGQFATNVNRFFETLPKSR